MRRPSAALLKADSLRVQQMANEDPNYLSAYDICLRCEEQFAADENKLRYIRILGYLLLNAPDRAVRSEVTRCIHSRRQDDSDLANLGFFFERYFAFYPVSSHSLYANLSTIFSSPEAQRSNAETELSRVKVLLRGCELEGTNESRHL